MRGLWWALSGARDRKRPFVLQGQGACMAGWGFSWRGPARAVSLPCCTAPHEFRTQCGLVTQRFDRERDTIYPGSGYVFQQQTSGITRWTDGFMWSDSTHHTGVGGPMIYKQMQENDRGVRCVVHNGLRKKSARCLEDATMHLVTYYYDVCVRGEGARERERRTGRCGRGGVFVVVFFVCPRFVDVPCSRPAPAPFPAPQ